jgi:hypothetical protein
MEATSTLQLSPALLRELWKAMAASKKRNVLASSKAKPSARLWLRFNPPTSHCSSLRERGKPPSFPFQTVCLSPLQGAQRLAPCPWTDPRRGLPRMNRLSGPAGSPVRRRVGRRMPRWYGGWAGVCRGGSRARRPTSRKWAAQSQSHWFGYSRTCYLT